MLAYYDENGKRKFAHRERNKESLAREAIRQLRKDLEKRGPKAVKNKVVTFAHLADYCETEIYVQAEHNEEGEKLIPACKNHPHTNHISNISDNSSRVGNSRTFRSLT